MLFINLPIKSDVPLVAPSDICCNCGTTENIKAVQTDLRRMPLMGFAGAEIKITLPFPYCEVCSKTANRKRPNVLGIAAISALIAIIFGMAWLFLGPQTSEETTLYVVAPSLAVLSLALVIGYYTLRKPSASQSSYYQPVQLKNTGHKWPADITGLELKFSNSQYAQKFAAANQAAIAAKKLKVSGA